MSNPAGIPLNDLEVMAMKGIQAREREIQDKHVNPLREDFTKLTRFITDRLGLAQDALGTTHQLNFENFQVVQAPPPDQQPANPGAMQPASVPAQPAHPANSRPSVIPSSLDRG